MTNPLDPKAEFIAAQEALGSHPDGGTGSARSALLRTAGALDRRSKSRAKAGAIPTGFRELDGIIRGWAPGQLAVIAGVTGMGMTTLALSFARAAAIGVGRSCLLTSFDWSDEQVMFRILSAEARVPLVRLWSAELVEQDWGKLARRMSAIADAPLHIACTLSELGDKFREEVLDAHQKQPFELLVIDAADRLTQSRWHHAGSERWLGGALKELANELRVAVIATRTLEAKSTTSESAWPRLPDLRHVDHTLEDEADTVLLMHREDYYEDESPRAGEVDIVVAKHRTRGGGSIILAGQYHYACLVEIGI